MLGRRVEVDIAVRQKVYHLGGVGLLPCRREVA